MFRPGSGLLWPPSSPLCSVPVSHPSSAAAASVKKIFSFQKGSFSHCSGDGEVSSFLSIDNIQRDSLNYLLNQNTGVKICMFYKYSNHNTHTQYKRQIKL